MSYIYTVRPVKDAIEIAIQYRDFEISNDGQMAIYGIDTKNWPSGTEFKSDKKILSGYFKTKDGYSMPLRYCTENEENKPEVPEFIKDLYQLVKKDCSGVRCSKCPLYYFKISTGDTYVVCANLYDWLEREYPEL